MIDSTKEQVLRLLKDVWESDEFKLQDTTRARALRLELVTRLLSGVMTDNERAQLHGLPNGCRMREGAKILSKENLTCGEYVWVGENAILDASGGLELGAHVTIGSGVFVWSHTSVLSSLLGQNQSGNPWIRRSLTRIGKHSFVGGPSVINPGVTIGERCVILPMSVVTTDVPDGTMFGGSPASLRRNIDEAWLARERQKFSEN
ncbi:acyltransferase [Paucibacter sp. TC2R-5]|uniref:acyltransferase n=1 Tax=Paucibacter sp. TC2R-5 TaxID=2893555 RepID=UPI0021E49503|nr:acyltransferase [Paucibacter sp. TC2R-5]MCV2361781.1 acyltransferase [Paucibacter sp. TC2R-5]